MDKFVLLLVVTVFVHFQCSVDAQKFETVLEECKISEKATDNDFLNLKMNIKPKTKPMKCLCACLNEKFGKPISIKYFKAVINTECQYGVWVTTGVKNNKLNPEGLVAYVKKLPSYSDKVQQSVNEIIEECKNIQDPDRCEFASKLDDCITDGATKRGIKLFAK